MVLQAAVHALDPVYPMEEQILEVLRFHRPEPGRWAVNGFRAGRVCMGEETMFGSMIRHIVWGRVSLARFEPVLVALVPALPNGPLHTCVWGPLGQTPRCEFRGAAAGNARHRRP